MHYTEIGFVNTKEMFRRAYEGGYAVPAYNFVNMEQLQAIVTACIDTRSHVIIQASKRVRQYVGREFVRHMAQAAVEVVRSSGSGIPCAFHLDHGDSPDECAASIEDGFSSVMIDGSALPAKYVDMVNYYGGRLMEVVGIPEEQVREAAASCVCKINIASDALLTTTAVVRKVLAEDPGVFDTREYLGPAREALVGLYSWKNREVLGSAGRV